MGLTIYSKAYNKDFDCSYSGFARLRMNLAMAINEDFGRLYYAYIFDAPKGDAFIPSAADRLNNFFATNKLFNSGDLDDVLDFFFQSDCRGSLSCVACGKLYNLIKDYDFGGNIFMYAAYSAGNDYEEFKQLLLSCKKKRRKLYWY